MYKYIQNKKRQQAKNFQTVELKLLQIKCLPSHTQADTIFNSKVKNTEWHKEVSAYIE